MHADKSHKLIPALLFGITILSALTSRIIESEFFLELSRMGGTALFYFWPGYFLVRLLRWRTPALTLSITALSFAGSITLWYLAALMIFSLRCYTDTALLISLIVIYLPGLTFFLLRRDNRDEPGVPPPYRLLTLIVTSLSLLLIAMVWEFRQEFYHLYDTNYFLTIVRKFAELDRIEITSAQVHNGLVNQAYGFNSYLLGVGLLAKFLNQDVMLIWGTLSIYGILIFISAVYLLASRLFNSAWIGGMVTSFILIYHLAGHFILPPSTYANPSMLTLPLSFVCLWIFTELIKNPNIYNRLAFGLIIASVISLHPFGSLLTAFYIGGFFLLSMITEKREEKRKIAVEVIRSAAAVGIFLFPYLVLRYSHGFPDGGPLFTLRWDHIAINCRRQLIRVLTEDLYETRYLIGFMTNPSRIMYIHPWTGWLGIPFLTILYWRKMRINRLYANLLLGGSLLIIGISFNPWLFPYAAGFLTPTFLMRLGVMNLILAIGILGAAAAGIATLIRHLKSKRLQYAVFIFLAVLGCLFLIKFTVRRYNERDDYIRKYAPSRGRSFSLITEADGRKDPLLRAIRRELQPGEGILNTCWKFNNSSLSHLVNTRCYLPRSSTHGHCALTQDEFRKRKTNLNRFINEPDPARRSRLVKAMGLRYVMTDGTLGLGKPFFELIATSNLGPKLYLYQARDPGTVGEKAGKAISSSQ